MPPPSPVPQLATDRPSPGANVIIEAFKPGTAPGEGLSIANWGEGGEGGGGGGRRVSREAEKAVYSGTGGLY